MFNVKLNKTCFNVLIYTNQNSFVYILVFDIYLSSLASSFIQYFELG